VLPLLGRYEPVVAVTRQGDRYETRGWLETEASVYQRRNRREDRFPTPTSKRLLAVAEEMLEGEIAYRRGEHDAPFYTAKNMPLWTGTC
jgi:hypothetical protein